MPPTIHIDTDDFRRYPLSEEELYSWWVEFHTKHPYPLYGIVLATSADIQVTSFVEKHRKELGEWSGKDCSFIFFRDLASAKLFRSYTFHEHESSLFPIILHVTESDSTADLPCFLFFEELFSGKYLHVSLKGLTEQEISILTREMFAYLRRRRNTTPFNRLRSYKHSRTIEITAKEILKFLNIGLRSVVNHLVDLLSSKFF